MIPALLQRHLDRVSCFVPMLGAYVDQRSGTAFLRQDRAAQGIWFAGHDRKEIVEHLELCNWKTEQGPLLGGHGPGLMPGE
jgi:hypothetical protein